MISKVVRRDMNAWQLYGALFGALLGLSLLVLSSQFYLELGEYRKQNEDLLDPEYIVVNKKVSVLETFQIRKAVFSGEEIQEVRDQPWVTKVEGFISNQFALSATAESDRFPDFYSDLFFEAVPDEYLDVKDPDWEWQPGKKIIPIILPQDYLNLYNFGFAPSQGLPQISAKTIGLVNFDINIRGKGRAASFPGRVIAFSNRINSILVPYTFLSWANAEFSYGQESKISRLVVEAVDPTLPEIIQFLDAKGYETIREKLKTSRLNGILKFLVRFVASLGILLIALSLLVFALSFQLIIQRSADKIRRLKWLGYSGTETASPFIRLYAVLIFSLAFFSGGFLWLLKAWLHRLSIGWGVPISATFHPWLISGGILLLMILFLTNALIILRQTHRL